MENSASFRQKSKSKQDDVCLILTLTGGSGHMQAAAAKKAEIKENEPECCIKTIDVMIDWLGPIFGNFLMSRWNIAQRQGNLLSLEIYTLSQRIADNLVWIPLFFSTLGFILKHKVTRVVDTQNMAMSSIIKAIRFAQFLTGRTIHYDKILTDLPTRGATHFFGPIRRLSRRDRALVNLITTKPLLKEETTEEEFWKSHCKISSLKVRYESLPLRPSFKRLVSFDKTKPLTLSFALNHPLELSYIERALKHSCLTLLPTEKSLEISIPTDHMVSVLMLGANPHKEAILGYVENFIRIIKEKHYLHRKDDLFVFCSEPPEKNCSLMQQIVDLIESTPAYPSSLSIIPLSYQNDAIVAPLFQRSNATFTRSGGLTSMEILSACKGKVWIHKGTPPAYLPKFFLSFKTIKEGMPPWEKGNADYLMAKKGATLITPETFEQFCSSYFTE